MNISNKAVLVDGVPRVEAWIQAWFHADRVVKDGDIGLYKEETRDKL